MLNVTANWQSSNTEVCAKKLSQILANNIDHGGRGIGLRKYVRYFRISRKKILFHIHFGSKMAKQNKARIRALKIFKMLYTGCSKKEAMSLLLSEST